MPVTPSGILSIPLQHLRVLIAATQAWQDWTDSDDAAEAAERVYPCDIPKPAASGEYTRAELGQTYPFAVVDFFKPERGYDGQAFVWDKSAENNYVNAGQLILDITAEVDEDHADSPSDALYAFTNPLGAMMEQMLELSGTSSGATSYLCIHRIELFQGPYRNDQAQNPSFGDTYRAQLKIQWGV